MVTDWQSWGAAGVRALGAVAGWARLVAAAAQGAADGARGVLWPPGEGNPDPRPTARPAPTERGEGSVGEGTPDPDPKTRPAPAEKPAAPPRTPKRRTAAQMAALRRTMEKDCVVCGVRFTAGSGMARYCPEHAPPGTRRRRAASRTNGRATGADDDGSSASAPPRTDCPRCGSAALVGGGCVACGWTAGDESARERWRLAGNPTAAELRSEKLADGQMMSQGKLERAR